MKHSYKYLLIPLISALMFGCGGSDDGDQSALLALAMGVDQPTQPRVHYLGSQEDAALLSDKFNIKVVDQAGLAKLSESRGEILIVDGRDTIDKELLGKVILAGNPVIALRNPDAIKGVVDGQRDSQASVSSGPDGNQSSSIAYGYYMASAAPESFHYNGPDPVRAAGAGVHWAISAMNERVGANIARDLGDPGDWQIIDSRNEVNDNHAEGKLGIKSKFYKLDESNNNYDYWAVEFSITSVPLGNWRTADTWVDFNSNNKHLSYTLADWSPLTYVGSGSSGISFGIFPGLSAGFSTSHNFTDAPTWQDGDPTAGTEELSWHTDVNEGSSTGSSTFTFKPGVSIRVPQGTSNPWNTKWYEGYQVKWKKSGSSQTQEAWMRWTPWNAYASSWTRFQNRISSDCVDVAASGTSNGTNISNWNCNNSNQQKWQLITHRDGWYSFKAKHSNKCLDVSGNSTADWANIHQWSCHGNDNQKWRLIDEGSGYFSIKSKRSNKCIRITGTANGGGISQWTCNGHQSQHFKWH